MVLVAASGPTETLLDALLRADVADAAEAMEQALEGGMEPIDVLDDVIAPALHEVGHRWEAGTIGIAEEHMASSVTHRMLSRLAPLLITAPPRSGPTVLMAGAQGERHVLGLQMACDVLEGAGYTVKFAGADLPARELLACAERERPALVALACTGSWAPAAEIRPAIAQLVEAQPELGVLLGGAGWRGFDAPSSRVLRVDNMRGLVPAAARLTGG